MHYEASDLPVRWAQKPWKEADRQDMLANLRRWHATWRWETPCPHCLWPFADFHLCVGADPLAKSPTDE